MKKILVTIFCTLFVSFGILAQSITIAQIDSSNFKINSIGAPELIIDIYVKLDAGFDVNSDNFSDLNSDLTLSLTSKKYKELALIGSNVTISKTPLRKGIRITVNGYSSKLSELLKKDDAEVYVLANKPLTYESFKAGSTSSKYQISVADIEKYTSQKIDITENMEKELIAARGGEIFMTQNNVDFGVIPKDQDNSDKFGLYANFNYRSKYAFLKNSPIYFYAKGRVSTEPEDSVNFLNIYPFNYNLASGKSQVSLQVGVDGNQTFSNYRIAGNFLWQGVIPNLLNFTMGHDRLRLKPVLKAGVKFYQEMGNNRPVTLDENQFSNQAFAELYYYIPIKDIYSLVIEVNSFYDFNDKVNNDNEVRVFYSATLGLEIPNSPIKTVFKYSKGANGINYQTDDQLTIGFMADLFGK